MDGEKGRRPSRVGGMTIHAGRRNAQGRMVRIGGVVVIGLVATHASVWRVVIVSARVTAVTIDCDMCPGQRVIIVVDRE